MATIELGDALFYQAGKSGVSAIVGIDSSNGITVTRVARYTFTSPEEGAHHINLTLYSGGLWNSTGSHIPIRFYIGTDPDSHANAGSTYAYHGELTLGDDSMTFTGSADVLLLPNIEYYLWVFPGRDDIFGCYYWRRTGDYTSTIETTGAAGLVYIDNGSGAEPYMICIEDGKEWFLFMPCIEDGAAWDLYS